MALDTVNRPSSTVSYRPPSIQRVIIAPRSGLAWMRAGLQVELEDFTSTMRRITRV